MHLLVAGTSEGTAKKVKRQKSDTREKNVTKGFPLWRIWVHIIVTCTEDGNIQGIARCTQTQLHTAGVTKHAAALSGGSE